MTANTKMTEERAREVLSDFHSTHTNDYSDGLCGFALCRVAIGFLEGLQAGRAEMAEEAAKYSFAFLHDHVLNKRPFIELVEHFEKIAQRDGGTKK